METLELLFKAGIPLDRHGKAVIGNAVYRAATGLHPQTLVWLHQNGVPIESGNFDEDPLIKAAYNGDALIVKTLLELGAEPRTEYLPDNGCKKSAYLVAEDEGHVEVCKLIAEFGGGPFTENSTAKDEHTFSEADSYSPEREWRLRLVSELSARLCGKPVQETVVDRAFDVYTMQSESQFPFQTVYSAGLSSHEQNGKNSELIMHLPMSWDLNHESFQTEEYEWPIDLFYDICSGVAKGEIPCVNPHLILSFDEPPQPLGKGTNLCCR